jgi:membrane dipeptidase
MNLPHAHTITQGVNKLLVKKLRIILIFASLFSFFGCGKDALEIHEKILTIDTHVDTPLVLRLNPEFDLSVRHDPHESGSKVDFPRMEEGGLDAVFFAVWIGQGARTPEGNVSAQEKALEIFDIIHENLGKHPDLAELALTAEDAYSIEKEGKRAVFIGMENGYPIGNDLSLITTYYDLGTRYITLCHTKNNDICDSSTDPEGPEHNGVSDFGKKVVAEMNRVGIMVDVSHLSDEAFYDVLEVTAAPVIASHSGARAIYDHPRHMSDEMLVKLAENGGVIQTIFMYIKDPENVATVEDVVDHIDHIVDVAGIDHVGIGSDFDGGGGVDGCFDVSELANITIELVNRGYSKEEIRKIWSGNLLRVFREVEEAAENS